MSRLHSQPLIAPSGAKDLTDIYNKDRTLLRTRSDAGFDVLRSNARVDPNKLAVIGYCFGGTLAVELAETGIPILGAVHG